MTAATAAAAMTMASWLGQGVATVAAATAAARMSAATAAATMAVGLLP